MIAKINVGNSLYGVLSYNQKKIDEMEAKVLFTNRMFESEDGKFNLQMCMKSFEMQLPQDIRTEKPIIHISLNPHPDDNLSDLMLSEIAQEYMDKLGYGNQPFIVYKHEDINRHHIHIVSLRVNEQGRKIDDKFEYRRSKDITRSLEEKYGLLPAEKYQSKGHSTFKKVDYNSGDIKKQISNVVKGVMSDYNFQTLGEYNAVLSLYNVHAEEIKGEVRGKAYHGIVYSATDDNGVKKGNPIKSSLIGKSVGIVSISQRFNRTNELWKKGSIRQDLKSTIQEVLNSSTSLAKFKDELNKKSIDVVLRQNDNGRIYGVTFIDHNNKLALNGSRLGKEFSANAINNIFQNNTVDFVDPKITEKSTSIKVDNNSNDTEHVGAKEHHSYHTDGGSLLGDIIKMASGNDGANDDYINYNRRKKKRKRRYGRQQ